MRSFAIRAMSAALGVSAALVAISVVAGAFRVRQQGWDMPSTSACRTPAACLSTGLVASTGTIVVYARRISALALLSSNTVSMMRFVPSTLPLLTPVASRLSDGGRRCCSLRHLQ